MTCATCDDLRRQLREAREEIEAWETGAADAVRRGLTLERLDRWAGTLGVAPAPARVLLALVDAAPGVVRLEPLARVAVPGREACDLVSPENLIRTYVCRLRKALEPLQLGSSILAVYGEGYRLSPADAAAIRQAMGDAA